MYVTRKNISEKKKISAFTQRTGALLLSLMENTSTVLAEHIHRMRKISDLSQQRNVDMDIQSPK
jgi:hypothetical protein